MRSHFQLVPSTATANIDLISLANLKLGIGIAADDTSEDTELGVRITRASSLIAEQCNRRLAYADAVETFITDSRFFRGRHSLQGQLEYIPGDRHPLSLRLYPVAEIASVELNGTAIDETAYDFDADNGLIWLIGGTWSGKTVVTYSGGYASDAVPMPLQEAVVAIVRDARWSASTSDSDTGALRQVTDADQTVGYYAPTTTVAGAGVLPAGVADIIQQYRRISV